MLVDHSDPGAAGIAGGVQVGGPTLDFDRARIGLNEPGGNVHQGGLPRTVFPKEGVDLAGPEEELDSAQSLDGTKPPGHAAEVQGDTSGKIGGNGRGAQRPVGWSWKIQGIPRWFDNRSAIAFTPTCSVA